MSLSEDGQAIVDWLAGETWQEELNEKRRNVVFWNDAKQQLNTYVAPLESRVEAGTRSQSRKLQRWGIFLVQKLDNVDSDDEMSRQDELMNLANDIEGRLDALEKLNGKTVVIPKDEPRPNIDADAAQSHVFVAPIQLDIWER